MSSQPPPPLTPAPAPTPSPPTPSPGPPASTLSLPPRPPTPGLGPTADPSRVSLGARIGGSRSYRLVAGVYAWRRAILLVGAGGYGLMKYQSAKVAARERDTIPDKTYLYWKLYDGGIVEAKSHGADLTYLLNSSQGSPEEPPRVMSLFEVIRAIKFAEQDQRIHGIIADFSNLSAPSVPAVSLGLAQIEEIQDALLQLRRLKHEQLGKDEAGKPKWRSVAWSDTWTSQGQYLFASAFDEIYCQPTGEVPLVGMGSTLPFYGRLAKWLGIEVHAEARNEYKSFVQPYIDEGLTAPQRENHTQLLTDLNDNLMTYIARNRYPAQPGQAGLDKVKAMSLTGPYTASQSVKNGLLSGTCYRQDIIDSVTSPDDGGDDSRKIKGFYHYAKTMERAADKSERETMDIGVVYLQGTIGEPGEFGTAAVVRGLKEAGEDPLIGAVVLRIDTGGGGVVESDTIWGAVRDLREKQGKVVVASFGNASASGGYLVSTHADAILAAPSTVTGSIGVASLRPTFLAKFFDRFHVTLESIFTGSRSQDMTHALSPDELKRHSAAVDEMYADFKGRVCSGRGVSPDVIESIAGGRVMTGLTAFALHAPKAVVDGIKGLKVVVGGPEPAEVTKHKIVELTDDQAAEASIAAAYGVAAIADEEATSPFAIPRESTEVTSVTPGAKASTIEPENATAAAAAPSDALVERVPVSEPESNAAVALATATEAEKAAGSKAVSTAPGVYQFTPGKYGRGLVDGIGGIRDAAVYACELFISNGIAGYQAERPEMTQSQAIKELLPESNFAEGENGELLLEMDVRLKRFPVQKGFWQLIKESSKRGDSMEVLADLPRIAKAQAAMWLYAVASSVVANGMDEVAGAVGMSDARKGLGLGGAGSGKGAMRAEWSGVRLR